jgi:hypothetical protein
MPRCGSYRATVVPIAVIVPMIDRLVSMAGAASEVARTAAAVRSFKFILSPPVVDVINKKGEGAVPIIHAAVRAQKGGGSF